MKLLKELWQVLLLAAGPRHCSLSVRVKTMRIALSMWLRTAWLHRTDRLKHPGRETSQNAYVAVEHRVLLLSELPDEMAIWVLERIVRYCFDLGLIQSGSNFQSLFRSGTPPWWGAFHLTNTLRHMLDSVETWPFPQHVAIELLGRMAAWLPPDLTADRVNCDKIGESVRHLNAVLQGSSGPRPVAGRLYCDFCGWRN